MLTLTDLFLKYRNYIFRIIKIYMSSTFIIILNISRKTFNLYFFIYLYFIKKIITIVHYN